MALVVTIAGVNRSTVVLEDSIRITQLADSFTFTAELDIFDADSDITLTTGSHKVADEITFVDGATTYFGGFVASQDIETKEDGSRYLILQCQGYGILLTETLVEYEEYEGAADDAIIDDLFDTYLAAIDSETHVAQLDAGMDISFTEMPLSEIMEALCQRTGGRFYIDNSKKLHYFADENDDCGFDLSDTPDQVNSFSYYDATEKRIDASQIVNRARVVGADDFAVTRNDGASQGTYGIRGAIVPDHGLTTTAEMEERGDAILDKNKDPKVSYSLRTTKAGAVAGQEVDYKNVSLGLAALTTQTIRELYITWEQSEPVYEMTLGEVEISALTRPGYVDSQIRQIIITPAIPTSSRGWSHDIGFFALDHDTVGWTSDNIYLADGTVYAIDAGDTGNMGNPTYIFLDLDTSETVLQTTIDASVGVGTRKILVCVCEVVAVGKDAIFLVFGGRGSGILITADHIAANTITTNEIAANTIDAGNIAAGAIETDELYAGAVTAAKIAANTITADKIAMGLGNALFNNAEGLLLFGPYCEISPTEWWSLRRYLATLSGAFHQESGRWQGTRGLVIELAATNYVKNPVAGVDTASWANAGGSVVSRVATGAIFSTGVFKITNSDASGYVVTNPDTGVPTQGHTYTATAWVKGVGDSIGETAQLWFGELGGAAAGVGAGDSHTLTAAWTKLQATHTIAEADRTHVQVRMYLSASAATHYYYFDGVQCERTAYATSLIHGDAGTGYAWTGTAHDSNSTRTATEVNLDALVGLVASNATLSLRTVVQMPYDADATWPSAGANYIFEIYSAANRLILYYSDAVDKFKMYIDGADRLLSDAQTFKAGDQLEIVVTLDFTADDYNLYINGELIDNDMTNLAAPVATQWNLGTAFNGTAAGGFIFSEHAAFDRVLTAIEVAGMYALQRPLIDAGSLDTPGIYILDGKFKMASSLTGNRIEITGDGVKAIDSGGNTRATLDRDGLLLANVDVDKSRVKWGTDPDDPYASISAYEGVAGPYMVLDVPAAGSDDNAKVMMIAKGLGGHDDASLGVIAQGDSFVAKAFITVGATTNIQVFEDYVLLEGAIGMGSGNGDYAGAGIRDGMMWYRTDTDQMRLRVDGSWVTINTI